jgi:ribosome-associated protein
MLEALHKEIKYKMSRSGGAGGQHVNKVSTKVELIFNINRSSILSDRQKSTLFSKLKNRITTEGVLILQCAQTRSQLKNKEIVFKRFIELIKTALAPTKKRRPTKPSKSSVQRRLEKKKKLSEKKSNRRFKMD